MSSFDQVYNRRDTRSVKWDWMEKIYNINDASDILPMWVADMDFAAPTVVTEALQERINHPIFGYSYICEGCKTAVQSWLHNKHNWETDTEWMLFHHGVVPAIATVVETFTKPGASILVTPPVYPPFFSIPEKLGRKVEVSPLKESDGTYEMDFVSFEEKLRNGIELFILCNPHNPGGMVWSKESLIEIIRLCAQYDTVILSDEIHADLVYPGHTHCPLASLADNEADRIITCVAPTKTFNLAGVQAAVMIVTDAQKREQLRDHAAAHGQMELSPFGATALKAAYEHGEPWLVELLDVLSSNIDYAIETITSALPKVKIARPDATYLLWIDYRLTGLSEEEMMELLLHKGKLALEPGSKYGESGRGFMRMNIACPRKTLENGVDRFIHALS